MTATRTHDDASGPGSPADALGAIASALAAARPTTPATADPNVALAFSLGWQMAELGLPPGAPDASGDDEAPGLGGLEADQRLAILIAQVQAGLNRLREPLQRAGCTPIEVDAALRRGDADASAVRRLHAKILGELTAADFRLGKAFGLGAALAGLCRPPRMPAQIRGALSRPAVFSAL